MAEKPSMEPPSKSAVEAKVATKLALAQSYLDYQPIYSLAQQQ
jgi:hypothetical protein